MDQRKTKQVVVFLFLVSLVLLQCTVLFVLCCLDIASFFFLPVEQIVYCCTRVTCSRYLPLVICAAWLCTAAAVYIYIYTRGRWLQFSNWSKFFLGKKSCDRLKNPWSIDDDTGVVILRCLSPLVFYVWKTPNFVLHSRERRFNHRDNNNRFIFGGCFIDTERPLVCDPLEATMIWRVYPLYIPY